MNDQENVIKRAQGFRACNRVTQRPRRQGTLPIAPLLRPQHVRADARLSERRTRQATCRNTLDFVGLPTCGRLQAYFSTGPTRPVATDFSKASNTCTGFSNCSWVRGCLPVLNMSTNVLTPVR